MMKKNEDHCGCKTVYTPQGLKGDPGDPGANGSSDTSGITYDGSLIACGSDNATNIYPGDDMNVILGKILAHICSRIPPIIRVKPNETFSATGVFTDSEVTIPEDGYYNIRVGLQVFNQIVASGDRFISEFALSKNGTSPIASQNNRVAKIDRIGEGDGIGWSQYDDKY